MSWLYVLWHSWFNTVGVSRTALPTSIVHVEEEKKTLVSPVVQTGFLCLRLKYSLTQREHKAEQMECKSDNSWYTLFDRLGK